MNQQDINSQAHYLQNKAYSVLEESGIAEVWKNFGCRVEIVGSLRMGFLINHRDIDLHVYSSGITEESSFVIAATVSRLVGVEEITCINGLHSSERCMAWHVKYRSPNGEIWKFDIIHIEAGSEYDGFFERMADRIIEVATEQQRDTILRLKYETPENENIHGVEYYEAVIADGIEELEDLRKWISDHRTKPQYYWIP